MFRSPSHSQPHGLKRWWFIAGRTPLVSFAEIKTLFKNGSHEITGPLIRTTWSEIPGATPAEAIKRLGGTVKLGEELTLNVLENDLQAAMLTELERLEGKIEFGISLYTGVDTVRLGTLEQLERWGKALKQKLKKTGISVRYVESREPVLSSVSVEKNGLTKRGLEFLVYEESDGSFSLAKTLAVQPFEALGARDFGRPGRDDTSGMLPPKLALMLLNLTGAEKDQTVLDPFCGSGTIVTEAMLVGFKKIIGADLSDKAVEDTKKNVAWQQTQNFSSSEVKIFQSDAAELDGKLPSESIDAIATEPYLGKPLRGGETKAMLDTQVKDLKQIYLAAFKAFSKILKPGAAVVFIIPCFKYQNTWLRIDCAKEIKKYGFIPSPLLSDSDFVLYARPNQRVGREIWRFKKN